MAKVSKFCRKFRVFILFIVFAIVFHFGYSFSKVEGDSMFPTFKDGERLLVDEWTYRFFNPEKGDVVIMKDPEEKGDKLVKRVIATGGDTIQIKEGFLYLNEKRLKDSFSNIKILIYLVDENDNRLKYWNGPDVGQDVIELENNGQRKIPEGYVWVIGDNRESSWYGLIKVSKISGKIIM
tara:strand:+ start:67 stop:606 length:540 start_codon:yes stop_codon:yes gene_type:complete